jgi:hypothetical protein
VILDREPNCSLRVGAYWSVYEFTDQSAGLEAVPPGRGSTRICWHAIFICRGPLWYDKPLKQREFLSRQAAIRQVTSTSSVNFPRDMAVSLGFCRYSPCLRMCHRMARPQGCVDHAVCLQPQTARQPLRCFFLCFVVQEDLRLPDSGTYAGVHGIGLVARDEIRGRDSPLTNRTSDVPRAASSIYLERRTVGPAR